MDFQFKAGPKDACDFGNEENEYILEIKFTSLTFEDETIKTAQLMFLYGDMLTKSSIKILEKEKSENGEKNQIECEPQIYVIHSTPNNLAEKFQTVPLIFLLINEEDQKMIGQD